MAYGVLGLSPWEFYSMTLYEFVRAVEGYYWERERQRLDAAWALSNVINTCGNLKKGHRVKIEDLVAKRSSRAARNPFYRALMGLPAIGRYRLPNSDGSDQDN